MPCAEYEEKPPLCCSGLSTNESTNLMIKDSSLCMGLLLIFYGGTSRFTYQWCFGYNFQILYCKNHNKVHMILCNHTIFGSHDNFFDNCLDKGDTLYCHPSTDSFTKDMCDAFIKGITDSGNEYIISDLYEMGFDPVMKEEEYLRDANYRDTPAVADDVRKEQEKINSADAIAFVYPVFWTEATAMLVGWFDRVWSYGFAYGNKTMKLLDKAIILCSAGNSLDRLERFGLLDSMKKVMLGDRLFGRVKGSEFIVFDSTSRENELREKNRNLNLKKAYEKGRTLFA